MVKSPFQIIFELLVLLISTTVEGIRIIFEKIVELFESLVYLAGTGMVGLLISSVIGGLVIIFISKFIFGNTKSLVKILLVYAGFILVISILFIITKT
ncbi:MAG: hypothetical protein GF368_04800 [Candidatus Aenigmarchaeota archaeon]|nr:hypothetical protein [Candidatus Aenigmarchaeota archaeon]